MTAQELIQQAQTAIAKEVGETILYTRQSRDVTAPIEAKAFVHSPVAGAAGSNRNAKDFLEDICIFSGITLNFRPKKGDTLTHIGKVWTVDEIHGAFGSNGGTGILKCTANKIHLAENRFGNR